MTDKANDNGRKKLTIYLDADDTIILTAKRMIEMLNERHGLGKKTSDYHDLEYRSIFKWCTVDYTRQIMDSDEFWNGVEFSPGFLSFYERNKDKFEFTVLTKGCTSLLERKKRFLDGAVAPYNFHGIIMMKDDEGKMMAKNKGSRLSMKWSIHVDDEVENLRNSKAPIKILIKTYGDRYWNMDHANIPNLYVVDDWDQAAQIIEFFNEHQEFLSDNERYYD